MSKPEPVAWMYVADEDVWFDTDAPQLHKGHRKPTSELYDKSALDAVRDAALEEAAKQMDAHSKAHYQLATHDPHNHSWTLAEFSKGCAAAIRALKKEVPR